MKFELKKLSIIVLLINPLALISCKNSKRSEDDLIIHKDIEISRLKKTIEVYVQKLWEKNQEIKKLEELHTQLQQINKNNINEITKLHEKIKELEAEISEKKAKINLLLQENVQQIERISELEKLLEEGNQTQTAKINELSYRLSQLQEKLKVCLEQVDVKTKEIVRLNELVTTLKKNYQMAIDKLEQQIQALQQEKVQFQEKINQLNALIDEFYKKTENRKNNPHKIGIYLCEEMNKNADEIYNIFNSARRNIISQAMTDFFKSDIFIINLNLISYNKRDNYPEHPSLILNEILVKTNTNKEDYKLKMNYLKQNDLVTLEVTWTVNETKYWTEYQKKEGRCSIPSF